jgi:hypothetical protein
MLSILKPAAMDKDLLDLVIQLAIMNKFPHHVHIGVLALVDSLLD